MMPSPAPVVALPAATPATPDELHALRGALYDCEREVLARVETWAAMSTRCTPATRQLLLDRMRKAQGARAQAQTAYDAACAKGFGA